MATFTYVAIDKKGKEVRGSVDADTKEKAIAQVKKDGLTIASLNAAGVLDRDVNLSFLDKKPKSRDMAVFCRQFVSIINAGVSIVSALGMLGQQTENKRLKKALVNCKVAIEKGETFSTAMAQQKGIFNDLFITLAAAGEASGSLDVSFTRLAEQTEKDAKLKATIKKSLTYPAVVLIVAIGVIVGMLAFVIPRFQTMFDAVGGKLPGITLALVAASAFIREKWYILLVIVLALVFGIRAFAKTQAGKVFFGTISMKLPLVGNMVIKSACARMARTLSTLTSSGIGFIDAIQITSETMTNIHFRRALEEARDDVAMGMPLSESLERSKMFPPLVYQMIAIGEETGDLGGMLGKLAEYYEDEVDQATAQVMAALEPAIIILLAAIVGTIVMACILPMMSLYEALDSM